jgi:hypothetical protein
MQELITPVNLVEYEALGDSITAVLPRRELEAARRTNETAQLWFELGSEAGEEQGRLTIDIASADLVEILRTSTGEDVTLALDSEAIAGLFDEPDVEAHGMRGALAIAVVTGAFMAPAGLAATPQSVSPAAKPQATSVAAKGQVSRAAVESQVSRAGATSQVSRAAVKSQISKAAAKSQVSRAAAKSQVSRAAAGALAIKAAGIRYR